MKKIEAIVRSGLREDIVTAIKKKGVGGVTIHQVQGQGSQDPPLVGQFFSSDMIICVVDDLKLNDVLETITDIAGTGTKGDGKVFVTTVDEALDICTKKRGTASI